MLSSKKFTLGLSFLLTLTVVGGSFALQPDPTDARAALSSQTAGVTDSTPAPIGSRIGILAAEANPAALRIIASEAREIRQAEAKKAERERRKKARQEAREEARRKEAREARRLERLREERRLARIVSTEGLLGSITYSKARKMDGRVKTIVANIPGRTSQAGWVRSMNLLTSQKPDFIMLNEMASRSTAEIQALAPAFTVVRGVRDTSPGGSQSLNNVILYRTSAWSPIASGMVKVVDDDRPIFKGKRVLWDRYATWALLKNEEGARMGLISTHMPTNPGKYPEKWGGPSRVSLYSSGMDRIRAMESQLSKYGPVIIGGDMNSHVGQGPWTAAAKLALSGYTFTKNSGVIYVFNRAPLTLDYREELPVDSDHPALLTLHSFNGARAVE